MKLNIGDVMCVFGVCIQFVFMDGFADSYLLNIVLNTFILVSKMQKFAMT